MFKNLQYKALVKRYAKAFCDSIKQKDQNLIKDELLQLDKVFSSTFTAEQLKYLKIIEGKTQFFIVQNFLKKYSFNEIVANLCLLLAKNKRLNILPEVIQEILFTLDLSNNILTAKVTSVKELTNEETSNIILALKRKYHNDIKIESIIDKKILGGLMITVGSKMFDDSLSGKFKKIEKILN